MASSPVSLPALQVPPSPISSSPSSDTIFSLPFRNPSIAPFLLHKPHFLSRPHKSASLSCHCRSSGSSSESASQFEDEDEDLPSVGGFLKNLARKFDDFMKSLSGDATETMEVVGVEEDRFGFVEDWGWERWEKHFVEVEEQERLISVLKSKLRHVIDNEDYEEAARIKVAIAAIATKDDVGSVVSYLKKSIDEERYQDAAFVHDNAGAGLVGWWAGVSDDNKDSYGCIIRIKAEHGRYVARSYSPRQLATSKVGAPLFEIFLIADASGDYKQQVVYLKRRVPSLSSPLILPKLSTSSSTMNNVNPSGGKSDLFNPSTDESEASKDGNGSDVADVLPGFPPGLQIPVPDVQVKVLKVTIPHKVDHDSVSFITGQLMQDEDKEGEEEEEEKVEIDMGNAEDRVDKGDDENDDIDLRTNVGLSDREDHNEFVSKFIVSGLMQKFSSSVSTKDLLRVPGKLEKKGRKSFSLTVENDDDRDTFVGEDQSLTKRKSKFKGRRSPQRLLYDLEKYAKKGERVPMKVLKEVGELISFSLSQARTRQPLSGTTTFNRIEFPEIIDPLNGLYLGSHGPFAHEVIQLRHNFGQWKESSIAKEADLEFYEYVEAVKITGDPYVPAGQVAFRAKIGKRYQLPHKGIIPEEFGVIARYRGQGRLSEPGFQNPRWVDGELVILDGKLIKSGPVVGFVYWAPEPESQFLVFYQRLRLEE